MIAIENFHIRPIQLKDAWSLCDFVVANEDRLKQYLPKTLAQNQTPTLSKAFVAQKTKQFDQREEFLFTIKEKESQELVGLVFLKALDWDKKQGEFAYCIGYSQEGKGITSDAVKTLSDHAFKELKLETLQIITHHSNLASVKIAKKCGFQWIRSLPNEFTPTQGDPITMELYELYNKR